MESVDKIVMFHLYCGTCKYKNVKETDEPCNECLTNTTNVYSHVPTKYDDGKQRKPGWKKDIDVNERGKV